MTEPRDDIITFGPTLARTMTTECAHDYVRGNAKRVVGGIEIAVTRTYDPVRLNVDLINYDLSPFTALTALTVAALQYGKLYGHVEAPPAAVLDQEHAEALHIKARELVQIIRACKLGRLGDLLMPGFERTEDQCVRLLVTALATAQLYRLDPLPKPAAEPDPTDPAPTLADMRAVVDDDAPAAEAEHREAAE